MARSPDFWTQVRNQFKPQEVLTGARGQRFYTDRDDSPESDLRITFEIGAATTPRVLLTGHRGCGKTSLLVRLLEHFKRGYFLVYFDIEHNLDKENFTQVDLLYLIGGAIYRVAERERLKPSRDIFTDLARAVYTLVETEKEKAKEEALNAVELVKGVICFGARALGSKFGEQLAEALLKPFTFTSGVSQEAVRERRVQPQVQQIVDCVNRLIADVETKAEKPLLLVVDGLDKIAKTDLADLLFVESRALLGPACRALYTAPMSLYKAFPQLSQDFADVCPLPNVKLWEREDDSARTPQGYETMREVVVRRLRAVPKTDDLISTDALDLLIAHSGGVMRWLIKLFHDACIAAQKAKADAITESAARQAIKRNAQGFQIGQDAERRKELQIVRKDKIPSGNDLSRQLLQDQFILAYANEEVWYDVHPLLWSTLKEKTVMMP